jgi:hypothetical protein
MNPTNNRNEEKIKYHRNTVMCIGVTIDGVWIEDVIYWTL